MFCIDNRCTDIYFNLAAEEYLLKQKRENYFMLWQATPTVVIGKHQRVEAEVDTDYTQQYGVRIARRFSGGGAVYHDAGNVNLTFIETATQPDFNYYLQQTIDFLATVGITASADSRLGVYIDGQKISGSAQCIHKNRVMYHCTLLFSTNIEALNASLNGRSEPEVLAPGSHTVRAVPSVKSEGTNVCRHLQQPPDMRRFLRLLFHYFLSENGENPIYHFTRNDIEAIERLKREKYATEAWIWGN